MYSKNQSLILYIIANRLGCSITEIMKLCYLLDLCVYQKTNSKVTTFEYIRYTYGPFDQNIYTEVNQLVKDGVLKYTCHFLTSGDEVCKYELIRPDQVDLECDGEVKALIDEALIDFAPFNAYELTKLAYQTKPMRALKATLGGNEHIGDSLDLTTTIEG